MGYMNNTAVSRQQHARGGRVQVMSELEEFRRQWTANMVRYWQERIDKLRINDTGTLRSCIMGMIHSGPITTIEHSFLTYGKFVSDGVGREFGNGYTDSMGRSYSFKRGGEYTFNDGQVPYLDYDYREAHGLDKPKKVGPKWGGKVAGGQQRRKRDWFFRKYYSSRMVLNEMEMAAYGEAYQGMMTMACDEIIKGVRIL